MHTSYVIETLKGAYCSIRRLLLFYVKHDVRYVVVRYVRAKILLYTLLVGPG